MDAFLSSDQRKIISLNTLSIKMKKTIKFPIQKPEKEQSKPK